MATYHGQRVDVMESECTIMEQEIINKIDDDEHSITTVGEAISNRAAEIQAIKSQGRSINKQLGNMNVRVSGLVTHLERITTRLNSADTRLNRLDGHLSRVDTRLYSIDTRLHSLDVFVEQRGQDSTDIKHYLCSLEQYCNNLTGRVETLEQRFDGLETKVDLILELLGGGGRKKSRDE